MFSILEMFTIGVGPSSSHTVGPMVAASRFAASLERDGILNRVGRVRTVLYGSLALTGLGHGTDRATVAGLEGNVPKTVDTDHMSNIRMECEAGGELMLNGTHRIDFDYGRDVVMDVWHRMAAHPNGMRFQAFDRQNNLIDEQVWYSIGGGFVRQGDADDLMIGIHEKPPAGTAFADQTDDSSTDIDMDMPYPFTTCDELISLCDERHMSVADVVWANETAMRSAVQVRSDLDTVWHVMRRCVQHGCNTNQTVLPGGLDVPRRAPKCMQGSHPTATCSNGTAGAPTPYSNHRTPHGSTCSHWRFPRRTRQADASSPRLPTVRLASFRRCSTIIGISWIMRMRMVW